MDNGKWVYRHLMEAKEKASWSKDPTRKVGCVAIGEDGDPVSNGFNGFARKIIDSPERLNNREEKYKYIIHAEMNCIFNSSRTGKSMKGSDVYVYGLPVCSNCANGLIQAGVKSVTAAYSFEEIHQRESYINIWKPMGDLSKSLFEEAGIPYKIYDIPELEKLRED